MWLRESIRALYFADFWEVNKMCGWGCKPRSGQMAAENHFKLLQDLCWVISVSVSVWASLCGFHITLKTTRRHFLPAFNILIANSHYLPEKTQQIEKWRLRWCVWISHVAMIWQIQIQLPCTITEKQCSLNNLSGRWWNYHQCRQNHSSIKFLLIFFPFFDVAADMSLILIHASPLLSPESGSRHFPSTSWMGRVQTDLFIRRSTERHFHTEKWVLDPILPPRTLHCSWKEKGPCLPSSKL